MNRIHAIGEPGDDVQLPGNTELPGTGTDQPGPDIVPEPAPDLPTDNPDTPGSDVR